MGNIEDELALNLVHDHSEDEYKMSDDEELARAHDLVEQYCVSLEAYLKQLPLHDCTLTIEAIQHTVGSNTK